MSSDQTPFHFTITKQDEGSGARVGMVSTRHGRFPTPIFMPVGTQGTVKTLCPHELKEAGVEIILGNTYHLYLRPGPELLARAGGLHSFMNWDRPILTDSGGYQVFSLSDLRRITEEGVTFQSHWDGSSHLFTPEKVIEIQRAIGSDIIMVLDECTPYPCSSDYARRSQERTTRWARRCLEHQAAGSDQALFAIIQGGTFPELRRQSASALVAMEFQGYAIGGLAVGEPKSVMYEMTRVSLAQLPRDKPRYLMGVGKPEDLVAGVALGIDMFDCVIPTRNARNGQMFTRQGRLVIRNAQYRNDLNPVEEHCSCYTCLNFSRAYLRHLFQAGEMLGPRLATLHNIRFFLDLMKQMREAILEGYFKLWCEEFYHRYEGGAWASLLRETGMEG